MTPIRVYVVETVAKDSTEPVLVTFDHDEASNLAEVLNEVRLQGRLDDDDAELGPVAVVRRALLIFQSFPLRKEVLS